MKATLDLLKHRVTAPESAMPEAVEGRVITALNEEAVVSARSRTVAASICRQLRGSR